MKPCRAFFLIPLVVGCQTTLSTAVGELERGRAPEAVARFRALEPQLGRLTRSEQADYALYRGLTHLALGDAHEADRWLSAVKAESDGDPRLLSAAERGRLLAARRSMGRMPGQ
ncbi:MAG TPA: hypothetical protein VER33_00105 [Polyangiaceae bacterium]|nr:hypothetical protein [Polyangiaceae bacterium]